MKEKNKDKKFAKQILQEGDHWPQKYDDWPQNYDDWPERPLRPGGGGLGGLKA